MTRFFGVIGALNALLAVAAGAFGAHALKQRLGPDALAVFDTAARYHFMHAIAVMFAAWQRSALAG